MHATRIDFIAPAARSSRAGAVLFVLGVLLAGASVMDDADRSEELTRTQERLKKARTAQKRAEAARAPLRGGEFAGFKQSGDVARRLALPWGDLLDALERADNEQVALLAVDPDAERGRLRLSGEAINMDALVKYIKSLDGKGGIAGLRVMTQQTKQGDAQHPVEFVLESNWSRGPQTAYVDGAKS
jgi:hypothetical protein